MGPKEVEKIAECVSIPKCPQHPPPNPKSNPRSNPSPPPSPRPAPSTPNTTPASAPPVAPTSKTAAANSSAAPAATSSVAPTSTNQPVDVARSSTDPETSGAPSIALLRWVGKQTPHQPTLCCCRCLSFLWPSTTKCHPDPERASKSNSISNLQLFSSRTAQNSVVKSKIQQLQQNKQNKDEI